MHDIDHVRLETDAEFEQWEGNPTADEYLESSPFEFEQFETDHHEADYPAEAECLFCENGEMELAAELLEVTTDSELEEFLGNLIKRASRSMGSTIPAAARLAIGSILKGAARKVLPAIGSAAGGYFAGAPGASMGSQAATAAGRLFGLELEGLSGEDQEFEVSRRFVRFAGDSVRNMARMAGSPDQQTAARNAAIAAARIHAPGFVKSQGKTGSHEPAVSQSSGRSGRWMRRGNKIVLYGV